MISSKMKLNSPFSDQQAQLIIFEYGCRQSLPRLEVYRRKLGTTEGLREIVEDVATTAPETKVSTGGDN